MTNRPQGPGDDDALAQGLRTGDLESIQRIRGWIRSAFASYRRQLHQESDDVEQDVLIALAGALEEGRFRGQSRLSTYTRVLVHHKCIDRLRARARREMVDIEETELQEPGPSPFERLNAADELRVTREVVEGMSRDCKELWGMIASGMSYRAIGERLGAAEGTIRVRALRCRKQALARRRVLIPGPPT